MDIVLEVSVDNLHSSVGMGLFYLYFLIFSRFPLWLNLF